MRGGIGGVAYSMINVHTPVIIPVDGGQMIRWTIDRTYHEIYRLIADCTQIKANIVTEVDY